MSKLYDSFGEMEPTTPNIMRLTSSPSSASVASRLYFNGQRSSRRTSFGSEPELMNFSDSEYQTEINDISSQISTLGRRVTEMEDLQTATNEENARLKTENAVMSQRVHILEEQLAQCELRWKEKLDDEIMRSRDTLKRCEIEKQLELERCTSDNRILEKDLSYAKKEKIKLEEEMKKMEKQLNNLSKKVDELQFYCENLEEEKKEISKKFQEYQYERQNDLMNNSEMMDELTRENEELRQKSHGISRHGSIFNQISILEEENVELKNEMRRLMQQNEDLQAELLHDSVMKGRHLLEDNIASLADELNGKDTTELMKALKEQEICNQQLRTYINGILMRVIEIHPEILEIKDEDLPSNKNTKTSESSSSS
uniref:Nuclear fallout (inferred by orthology to a D. melanogaster protein) n=1 Tax=Strongyloides venezuelensis TaxID=75913 RepID=A0A0K0G4L9_STRVS